MKFGVCGNFDLHAKAAKLAYDYGEWSVPNLLKPLEPESSFRTNLELIRKGELPIEAANGLLPRELKITGPDADPQELQKYISTTMARAEKAGIDVVVFGSGGARQIPEGFDTNKAHGQLVNFCTLMGPIASRHGVTVVIEPLNKKECNVLTTVEESAQLVKEVDHPNVKLLVDAYHMMKDDDPFQSIIEYGDLIRHVHIATKENRLAPGAEECDFKPFFEALKTAGYSSRISIEGNLKDPDAVLPQALSLMQELSSQ